MFSQFKKKLKIGEKKHIDEDQPNTEEAQIAEPPAEEETIKKNIESKLRRYRPLHRDSNFTGPNI